MPSYRNDVRLVGLNFVLVFLLDFFQLNNSYFTIDDIIFTGEFVIIFYASDYCVYFYWSLDSPTTLLRGTPDHQMVLIFFLCVS